MSRSSTITRTTAERRARPRSTKRSKAGGLSAVHPGDILLHDFMEPMDLSSYRLARLVGVATPTVNEIVRRRKSVTAEMALRLARYFGTSPQLWLNLQTQYDLEVASRRLGRELLRTIRPSAKVRPPTAHP